MGCLVLGRWVTHPVKSNTADGRRRLPHAGKRKLHKVPVYRFELDEGNWKVLWPGNPRPPTTILSVNQAIRGSAGQSKVSLPA